MRYVVSNSASGISSSLLCRAVGWLWDGSNYELYSIPGPMETIANGINNKHVQVGSYQPQPDIYPGFRRFNGQATPLIIKTPAGSLFPTPYDINENGTILGVANLDPNGYFPSVLIYPGAAVACCQRFRCRANLVSTLLTTTGSTTTAQEQMQFRGVPNLGTCCREVLYTVK